jgi:hypothetical protein
MKQTIVTLMAPAGADAAGNVVAARPDALGVEASVGLAIDATDDEELPEQATSIAARATTARSCRRDGLTRVGIG